MIERLYDASRAGVNIELIVRGVCCLRPGVKGVSENIRVISIVGRFLEHSRVFWFDNGGSPELYLSSADLMGRNLDRRVELMFPIEDPAWVEIIRREVLEQALKDNVRARLLNADGTHSRIVPSNGDQPVDSQLTTLQTRTKSTAAKQVVLRESAQAT